MSVQERIIADHKLQAKEWATARSQHTSQVETIREQIADLEYRFENACLESSIRTRAQLIMEYLDGKQGTWDPHKDIEVEVEFDKIMASNDLGQEGFTKTPEDVLSLGCGAQE